jgi:2-keto-4-pentenoate hydratase
MNDLAKALVSARRGGARLSAGFGNLPSIEEAYSVQDRVQALLRGQIAGWKVARTPDGEVISAPILSDVVFQSGANVPMQIRMSHGFECELAFKVKHRLSDGSRTEYDIDDVLPALGGASAAFELLSCRTEQGFQSPRPLLVADNLGNGGIVLGATRADWRKLNLAEIAISLIIDDDKVVEKRRGNLNGNPLRAVVLLANHLTQRKLSWEPGQIIMTGAFAGVHHAKVGQRVEARLEGFKPVTMFVEAVQHEVGDEADASR